VRVPPRCLIAAAAITVVLGVTGRNAATQRTSGAVPVSVGYATGVDELRRWDAIVDGTIRSRELVPMSRRADGMLAGRTHEYHAQYVDGVPVHGAGVMRQLDRGVTVSLLGTLHRDIDIAAAPLLSAVEVAARVERATGAASIPGHPPQFVVLPLPDGSYARTYRLLTDDARIHFADAATGAVVHAVDAFDAQFPSVAGQAGDIVTLDLRFDGQRSAALLEPGPFRTPRWTASDVAVDADVHLHAARAYDYFARRFHWFGPDGAGGRIVSLVNAGIRGARAYRPPYGPDGGGAYVYGPAEGGPGLALQTVAHELMHGVTHFTVGQRTGTVAGLVTDFATGVRLGPREFTDGNGQTRSCETARFSIRIEGEWQSLPAWCRDGRFLLASDQGGGVAEAFADIFSTAVRFFHEEASGRAGYLVGGDDPAGPFRSLADPASLGGPDAYASRVELALAGNGERWSYSGFAFRKGRFAGATQDCCYGAEHWNSTILSHAFYLAVEGGTNRTTGLRVDGVGGAGREVIEAIFFRALTELMPPATSFPLAADAIRQSAHDLAPGSTAQRAVEQALLAVGLPPMYEGRRTAADGEHDLAYRTGEDGGDNRGAGVRRRDAGTGDDDGRDSDGVPADAESRAEAAGGAGFGAFAPAAGAAVVQSTAWDASATGVGHMNYESPHSNPIALLPDGSLLYVANTPADTVDVVDPATRTVVARINVGIDPVGIAVRPDGREVWVSNHVSDSVSVIDADPASPTRHQVLATIQVFDPAGRTRFDEPVGIAFAGNEKAYVALSSSNRIAIVDVASRSMTTYLQVTAQDPRALTVRGDRLFVVPFESNNQTQLSGCWPENIDGELCTFDARKHVTEAEGGNAQSLSLHYVADIVRHPDIPDRDLYVFDTTTDRLVEVVDTLGTLLYGIAADSQGGVYIAQTEARNDANGKAGTEQHGLAELENRAFLNRITRVPCNGGCGEPTLFELEPLPPDDPAPGMELATPFAIAVSDDDATLVVTAAASSRIFTVDAGTGAVLGRADVGAIPRGLALETTASGAPARAWVLNALANSVSLVDLTDRTAPRVEDTIALFDPTDPELKQGRIAFNSARASSTGTFACASCHPDGHTDQLLWVLDTPLCDVGCDQIQPRLVQDIRGLRGSAPYHWDGTFGDPYGGVNTASIRTPVEPNCDIDVPESCTLHVLEGALRTTMCDQADCETNDEGRPGPLSGAERTTLAKYLLSVPYPPSPDRPYTNTLSSAAMEGVRRFHFTKQCANCHRLPFWTMTNMGGSGMDVPSWRGANDRWKNSPQNRFFFADLVRGDTRGFPERTGFTNDANLFQMIVEGSVGFSGALGRQVTLNPDTAGSDETADLLDALEQSANEGGVVLQAEGVRLREEGASTTLALQYDGAAYRGRGDGDTRYSRQELTDLAAEGDLLLTITARLGRLADYDHPQPTLRPHELPILPMFPGGRPADFPELHAAGPMRLRGEHIREGAHVLVDGRRVTGGVACEEGTLPDCVDDTVLVALDRLPAEAGLHLLQVQNPEGLFSNDFPFHVLDAPARATSGNLIGSGGTFDGQGAWRANLTNASVTWDGEADFTIDATSSQPWRVQLSHHVAIREGVEYSLCYSAKGDDIRYIQVNVDTGPDDYRSLMGSGSTPEVGAATRGTGASLTRRYHRFRHRFISPEGDGWARITFTLAQSDVDVQIDDVGLYEGRGCGAP